MTFKACGKVNNGSLRESKYLMKDFLITVLFSLILAINHKHQDEFLKIHFSGKIFFKSYLNIIFFLLLFSAF